MPLTEPAEIDALLRKARTLAIVGASDRPDRASNFVMKAAQDRGYRTIPVNPRITGEHIHGEYVWRELGQIGVPLDIVVIFRRSEEVGPVVDEAIAAGARVVWMQLGIRNDAAAATAESAGLAVVEDMCLKIELGRSGISVAETA